MCMCVCVFVERGRERNQLEDDAVLIAQLKFMIINNIYK